MAEIHVFPTQGLGPDQIARLSADLAEAHSSGVDLSSRVPHIHAAGEALMQLSDQLEEQMTDLSVLGLENTNIETTLRNFIDQIKILADHAINFPANPLTGLASQKDISSYVKEEFSDNTAQRRFMPDFSLS